MTTKEFKEALKGLGFDLGNGFNSYYVSRGNDAFVKISKWNMWQIDTYHLPLNHLNENESLALMAAVFESAGTPVDKRDDN